MDKDKLLGMSVELVKAHLASSPVPTQNLPLLIKEIHGVLLDLAGAEHGHGDREPAAEPSDFEEHPAIRDGEPRVLNQELGAPEFAALDPWLAARLPRRIAAKLNREPSVHPSVFDDTLICLEDGAKVKLLRSYLRKRFNMSLAEYVDRWRLPDDYPSAPPSYLEVKRAHARATGLGYTLRAPKGTPRRRREV